MREERGGKYNQWEETTAIAWKENATPMEDVDTLHSLTLITYFISPKQAQLEVYEKPMSRGNRNLH